MSKTETRETPEYWRERVFRNSFTYRGERRWVSGWCIKVQWEGDRRTVRLVSESREGAAREAAEVFSRLRRGGWGAVERRRVASPGGDEVVRAVPRVGVRKYVSNLHAGFERELFAEIVHEGAVEQVALGTEEPADGRLRASVIQAEVGRFGWNWLGQRHSREVTVAVFWQENPMTCTYTTLLSAPARGGRSPGVSGSAGAGWKVLVVESDGPVRRALIQGLKPAEGMGCIRGCATPLEMPAGWNWDLIVVNRKFGPAVLRTLDLARGGEGGGVPRILEHGLYADSDAIFASVSGVSRGYFLRRVPVSRLLEPLLRSFPEGPAPSLTNEGRQVRRYFQAALEPMDAVAEPPGPAFSKRETQVLDLLGRGFSDKEIGNELGISVWTVHSHLKRIFGKYGVRTRTEAVVRHLQK